MWNYVTTTHTHTYDALWRFHDVTKFPRDDCSVQRRRWVRDESRICCGLHLELWLLWAWMLVKKIVLGPLVYRKSLSIFWYCFLNLKIFPSSVSKTLVIHKLSSSVLKFLFFSIKSDNASHFTTRTYFYRENDETLMDFFYNSIKRCFHN